jgi:hypothetical protein
MKYNPPYVNNSIVLNDLSATIQIQTHYMSRLYPKRLKNESFMELSISIFLLMRVPEIFQSQVCAILTTSKQQGVCTLWAPNIFVARHSSYTRIQSLKNQFVHSMEVQHSSQVEFTFHTHGEYKN